MLDANDHAAAVDVAHLDASDFRDAHPRRIGRCQCDPALQARDSFEKAYDFVVAQDFRQSARFAGIGNALRHLVLAKRHAIEKTQRAHDLVQRRPGDALARKMHLISADIFEAELVR